MPAIVTRCASRVRRVFRRGPRDYAKKKAIAHRRYRHAVRQALHERRDVEAIGTAVLTGRDVA